VKSAAGISGWFWVRIGTVLWQAATYYCGQVTIHAELILDQIGDLQTRIDALEKEIAARSRGDETAALLKTDSGFRPITAAAILALAPDPSTFQRGWVFSA
jgi:transposase